MGQANNPRGTHQGLCHEQWEDKGVADLSQSLVDLGLEVAVE